MRFAYHPSMCDPSFYLELGKAAESAGFDVITFPDSICYPKECDSTYPYNDDGSREFLDGVPFLEPFSIIPAIAAVTEKLEFSTFSTCFAYTEFNPNTSPTTAIRFYCFRSWLKNDVGFSSLVSSFSSIPRRKF